MRRRTFFPKNFVRSSESMLDSVERVVVVVAACRISPKKIVERVRVVRTDREFAESPSYEILKRNKPSVRTSF